MDGWSNDYKSVKSRFEDTLVLTLAGQEVIIKQTVEPLATVFDASIILAKLLEILPLPRSAIELGAGCGLPSIVLGLRGCPHVVATELLEVIPVLQYNISSACGPNVSVAELAWGTEISDQTYDLIIAADVLYDFDQYPGLVKTLISLSRPDTSILISYKKRFPDSEAWFREAASPHFSISEVTIRHPDYISDRVVVIELRRL